MGGTEFLLLAALWLAPSQGAQPAQSARREAVQAAPARAAAAPWLVTVMHHVGVDQLLSDLSQQGWRISVPDDSVAQDRSITNVTTGIVMDREGQVLARLVNASPQTNLANVTITTHDGRALHPASIQFDESTGYAVLRVPGLNIDPPAFAGEWKIVSGGERVRLLYRVPDRGAMFEAREFDATTPGASGASVPPGKVRRSSRPVLKTKVRENATWVTTADPLSFPEGRSTAESAEPTLIPITKQFRPIEVASLTSETDGGVVVDFTGQVLGVAQFVPPDRGVLKSVAELKALVDQLNLQRATPGRGWLGLKVQRPIESLVQPRSSITPSAETGLLVSEVIEGGPACKAGLKPQDLILSVNDLPVAAPSDLARLTTTMKIGTEFPIRVLRDGVSQTFNVEFAPRPGSASLGELPRNLGLAQEYQTRADAIPAPESPKRGTSAVGLLNTVGLHTEPLSPQLKQYFGIRDRGGVMVSEVKAQSPAHRSGLRAGDVIVRLNETDIGTPRGLGLVLRQLIQRRQIRFEVIRDRKTHFFTLPPLTPKQGGAVHAPNP